MHSIIITIFAIALQAASLYCLMQYAPAWVKTAPDYTRSVAASLSSVEEAFYRYGAANAGVMPVPTTAFDGGMEQFQSPTRHLPFLPKAPEGFSWKYGRGADYYVCLHATDGARPMEAGLYYGVKRLRKLLPEEQFIISAGASSCGSNVDVSGQEQSLPAPLSVTYFLRYVPGMSASTAVLPCVANGCLSTEVF
jgi:hypothetical protein